MGSDDPAKRWAGEPRRGDDAVDGRRTLDRTGLRRAAGAPGREGQVEKVEGKVLKVDRTGGKVTLRQPDGTSHEYLASQATLRDLKEGDTLEVKVRAPRTC